MEGRDEMMAYLKDQDAIEEIASIIPLRPNTARRNCTACPSPIREAPIFLDPDENFITNVHRNSLHLILAGSSGLGSGDVGFDINLYEIPLPTVTIVIALFNATLRT